MTTFRVRAYYPAQPDRLVLRTELDWYNDLRGHPTADGAEFFFESDRDWLYFKPCLHSPEGFRWLPGMNRVVTRAAGRRDVYPYFYAGLMGTLGPLRELDGVRFRVYFPAGYGENTLKRYPVMYVHDGGNLFLPEEAFLGRPWAIDRTLDQLHELAVIDQVLVVGIYPGDRMSALTNPGYVGFANWIGDRLRPFLDATHRTLTGPENTAVMGSSLGGVMALHSAWSRPDVFGMAACLSSTFGYADDLFDRIAYEHPPNIRIYLDSGWPRDNFERTLAMRDLLMHRGYELGSRLQYLVFPGERHNEHAWGGRVHVPFQWFFGRSMGG